MNSLRLRLVPTRPQMHETALAVLQLAGEAEGRDRGVARRAPRIVLLETERVAVGVAGHLERAQQVVMEPRLLAGLSF